MTTDHQALLQELLPKLDSPRRVGKEIMAFCPAHPDGTKHHRKGGRSLAVNPETGLIHCHAGCDFAAVLAGHGISPNGARPDVSATKTGSHTQIGDGDYGKLVTLYVYADPVTRQPLGEKGRFELPDGRKTFKWRKPGVQGWPEHSGLTMSSMPLWGAAEVLAAPLTQTVWFVEGEKAWAACHDHGLLAVSPPGGAGQRDFGDSLEILRGRPVRLWPDNDAPGRRLTAHVFTLLRGVAQPARIFACPLALKETGDAWDYFALGGPVEALDAVVPVEETVEYMAADALRVTIPTARGATALSFTSMELSPRALDCELAVHLLGEGQDVQDYHQRINLMSSSQRTELRRDLQDIYGKEHEWPRVLNAAFVRARESYLSQDLGPDLFEVAPMSGERFQVRTILPTGQPTVLFADGSTGKTYIALALAVHIGLGTPFLGYEVSRARVLYVDYEVNEQVIQFRIARLMRGLGLGGVLPGMIWYWPGRGIPLADQIGAIQRKVEREGIGVVIVDSAAAACGGEPEKAEVALRYFGALKGLGLTTLTLAHITKAGEDQKPFGSGFWSHEPRRTWYATRTTDEESDHIVVGMYCRKVNDGRMPAPFVLTMDFDGEEGPVAIGRSEMRDTPELQIKRALKVRLVDALRRGPRTGGSLSEELEVEPDTVGKTLRRFPATFVRVGTPVRGQDVTWALSQ